MHRFSALRGEMEGWKLVAENAQLATERAEMELRQAQRELKRLKPPD